MKGLSDCCCVAVLGFPEGSSECGDGPGSECWLDLFHRSPPSHPDGSPVCHAAHSCDSDCDSGYWLLCSAHM